MTPGKAYLTQEEIRGLARRSDLWGWALVGHAWAVIALALALFSLWPNPLTFVLAVILIGSRQLGLAILMHEAAHNALFRSRRLNETIGSWLCARPILADLASYRHYHLKHHRHTQTEDDPDLVLSAPFPTTPASLRRKFLRDLTGQTGLRQRAFQIGSLLRGGEQETEKLAQAFAGPVLGQAALANLVIFAMFWAAGAWWWWLAFWLLPLLTWFQLVLRIRNIAEHGVVERGGDALRNTRTTHANLIERALVAPYWVNYHLEHHLVMHVPCRNLPRLNRMLNARGLGTRMEVQPGYLAVLRLAASG